MLADYLTKLLQGRLFHLFRAVLLGHRHLSCLKELLPPSEQRVGINIGPASIPSLGRNNRPTGGARFERERARWEATRVKIHPAS